MTEHVRSAAPRAPRTAPAPARLSPLRAPCFPFAPRSLLLFLLLSLRISECFTLFLIVAETAVRRRRGDRAGLPGDRTARGGLRLPAGSLLPAALPAEHGVRSWWLRPPSVRLLLQGREKHLRGLRGFHM